MKCIIAATAFFAWLLFTVLMTLTVIPMIIVLLFNKKTRWFKVPGELRDMAMVE